MLRVRMDVGSCFSENAPFWAYAQAARPEGPKRSGARASRGGKRRRDGPGRGARSAFSEEIRCKGLEQLPGATAGVRVHACTQLGLRGRKVTSKVKSQELKSQASRVKSQELIKRYPPPKGTQNTRMICTEKSPSSLAGVGRRPRMIR